MTYYEALLFLHVAAAGIWIGSAVLYDLLFLRAKRAADPVLAERIGAHSEWLAKRLFIPTSLVVLVLGILLTTRRRGGSGDLWILIGLAGWAGTFVVGVAGIEPETKRIHAAIERGGPGDPEVAWRRRRVTALNYFDNLLLFVVVADMTIKPTGDDAAVLIVGGVIVAAAIAAVVRTFRAAGPELAAAPQA